MIPLYVGASCRVLKTILLEVGGILHSIVLLSLVIPRISQLMAVRLRVLGPLLLILGPCSPRPPPNSTISGR